MIIFTWRLKCKVKKKRLVALVLTISLIGGIKYLNNSKNNEFLIPDPFQSDNLENSDDDLDFNNNIYNGKKRGHKRSRKLS